MRFPEFTHLTTFRSGNRNMFENKIREAVSKREKSSTDRSHKICVFGKTQRTSFAWAMSSSREGSKQAKKEQQSRKCTRGFSHGGSFCRSTWSRSPAETTSFPPQSDCAGGGGGESKLNHLANGEERIREAQQKDPWNQKTRFSGPALP